MKASSLFHPQRDSIPFSNNNTIAYNITIIKKVLMVKYFEFLFFGVKSKPKRMGVSGINLVRAWEAPVVEERSIPSPGPPALSAQW